MGSCSPPERTNQGWRGRDPSGVNNIGWKRGASSAARSRAKAELVLELLTARFGKLPVRVVRRVQRGDPSALQRWGTRLLTAATLAEVFGEP